MKQNRILGTLSVAFGVLTLWSGGMVLFGPEMARIAAGQIVPFVLWFNFLSGAVYIVAGVGVFQGRHWGRVLAITLAFALTAVLIAFLVQIALVSGWEMRTLGALSLRLGFWIIVARFTVVGKASLF